MSSDTSVTPILVDGDAVEPAFEPESTAELCDFLRDLRASRRCLVVVGGGTRLAFGNLGGPFDVALSTRRLNRVIHYEPDDLTLAVEPGCTIQHITDLLREHRQTFALDAAHDHSATIGGSYATGLSGPRRLGGGSLKDWVIGVEVAGLDGVVAKAGGMVVKNVTGYDMMHLHYGALGAFGIVTRLNLKVFPRPDATRSVRLSYPGPLEAHSAGVALLGSQLQPTSLLVANEDGWNLHVRCDAPQTAIARLVERVIDVASTIASAIDQVVLEDERAAVRPFTSAADLLGQSAVARLPIPASRQADALVRVDAIGGQRICADLGSGLVYVASEATDDWIRHMTSVGEQPTFLKLPPELKQGVDVFGPLAAPAASVIRRLKDAYDPDRRINTGRFVLGL